MKKILIAPIAILGLASAVPSAMADVLVYEPFDYTPGSNHLTPLNGGLGFAEAWRRAQEGSNDSITVYTGAPGTGATNATAVSPGNLDGVFNNTAVQTTPSGSGNCFIDGASGDDRITANRKLSQSAGALAGTDKVLWASVIWTMDGTNFGRQVGFTLGTDGLAGRSVNVSTATSWGGSGAGDAMGVGGAFNSGAVTPTIWDNGNVVVRTTTGVKNVSNTYDNIVILKYVFADGASPDRVYAWAFGENETITEAAFNANAVFAEAVVDQDTLNMLSFSQSQASRESIDEIRLGDSFADVLSLPPPPKALITSFGISGSNGVINQTNKTIALTVPYTPWGVNGLASLAPTFTLTSGTCNQTSGAAPSPTFASANPVTYTVTDGAIVNNYAVTVTVTPGSTACVMQACDFGALGMAFIDEATATVLLTVPPSQPVTSLAPTFTLSPNATISPPSGSVRDFTNPVVYRVTAENGTTYKDYTVSVQSYATWAHSGSMFIDTTLTGANVTGSVSNFPLLIRFNSANFNFAQAQGDGRDIRFTTATGAALPYQIEQWDAAGGKAAVWVKIPTIAGNALQEIIMYWGKSGVNSLSSGPSVFSSSNGYASVIHLDDTLTDQTGTTTPTNLNTTAIDGLIGRARNFAAGQGVLCGSSISGLPTGSGPFSTGVWIRAAKAPGVILGWGIHESSQKKVVMSVASPPRINMDCWFGGATITGTASVPISEWTYVVHTFQTNGTRLYLNGALDASNNGGTMQLPTAGRLDIGGWQPFEGFNFVGDIDEVRISNVVRSADWVKLEYENQKPAQTLVGGIVPAGSDFSVSPTSVTMNEGTTTTLTAQAGGARKVYWIYKKNGQETVLATDQLTYTHTAGRVSADDSAIIQFKAVFATGTQTIDVPLTVLNTVPDPAFTLIPSTTSWDGRQTMTVTANITNLAAMQAAGFSTLNYKWAVSGVAVTRQANNGTLTLTRSQGSGPMTVTLTMDNGGVPVTNSVLINVQEPASDPWVQRTPDANEKPVDKQFFARNPETNMGTIFYTGTQAGATDVYLKVYTTDTGSDVLYATHRQALVGGAYSFAAPIAAGKTTYKVTYGTTTGGVDSAPLATVSDLICGDAFIIEGQSNALALQNTAPLDNTTNKWIRTYHLTEGWGYAVKKSATSPYSNYQLGVWGWYLANRLLTNNNMPICIINGAVGGTRIDQHRPNPAGHGTAGALYSIYANLYNRVLGAKLSHGIRGLLWHQGEQDQGAEGPDGDYDYKFYQQYFVDISAAWKQDFPNIRNYYMFQIWPGACGDTSRNDQLREVQRTLPRLYSNMKIMSTLGIVPGSSCHYDDDGYKVFSDLIGPLVEQDVYGSYTSNTYTAPNLQQAYFTSSAKNEIALVFDQNVAWNPGAPTLLFLANSSGATSGSVSGGSATGNTITLQVTGASAATTITYVKGLVSWLQANLLTGTNGIAALTFADVAIAPAPPAGLSATGGNGQVSLTWTAASGAISYKVKRSTTSGGPYTTIATTASTEYTDVSVVGGTPYYYVVSAVSAVGTSSNEGLDSNQATATPLGGYASWAANPAQGLTAGVNDGALIDPDFDGIPNLLEFVLGGAPMISSRAVMPAFEKVGGQWLFTYDRNRESLPPATTQIVQYGSNMVDWNDITIPATSAGAVTVIPGETFDQVIVTIPALGPKTFVRIKASE